MSLFFSESDSTDSNPHTPTRKRQRTQTPPSSQKKSQVVEVDSPVGLDEEVEANAAAATALAATTNAPKTPKKTKTPAAKTPKTTKTAAAKTKKAATPAVHQTPDNTRVKGASGKNKAKGKNVARRLDPPPQEVAHEEEEDDEEDQPGSVRLTAEQYEDCLEWVKSNPAVWEKGDPNYYDLDYREQLWKEKAKSMGMETAKLKKWFVNQRDMVTKTDVRMKKSGGPKRKPSFAALKRYERWSFIHGSISHRVNKDELKSVSLMSFYYFMAY